MSITAEIITIGTELLLGDIVDTNSATLARALRGLGLDVFRTTSVGDNPDRITQVISEACQRAQVILTSGGLGPTVDDATRVGIAQAIGRPLEFDGDSWAQIQDKFAQYGRTPTENNRQQAMLPQGAVAIENPVGTAPAFRVERETAVIIALPGVPSELEALLEAEVLPYLRTRFGASGVIRSRLVRTAGAGESWIDDKIQDLEKGRNPTVGLAAHPGRVDIRITAKADSEADAHAMLAGVEAELRSRLTTAIYGIDQDGLAKVVADQLARRQWRLCAVEAGGCGRLAAQLAEASGPLTGVLALPAALPADALAQAMSEMQARTGAEVCLGLSLQAAGDRQQAILHITTPIESSVAVRTYGGPPRSAPAWAACLLIDTLRRSLA